MISSPKEPVFKEIFGKDWDVLPAVMKRHYANRAYSDDVNICTGTLTISASPLGKALFPIFKLLGMLVPRTGENIPTTVRFMTDRGSNNLQYDRNITFPDGDSYRFHSSMQPVDGNELAEIMRCQLVWRMAYIWNGRKVILEHRGYAFKLFGWLIPLPITLLLGKSYAEETPIDDTSFAMMTEIRHPWWGQVYSYRGTFTMKDAA